MCEARNAEGRSQCLKLGVCRALKHETAGGLTLPLWWSHAQLQQPAIDRLFITAQVLGRGRHATMGNDDVLKLSGCVRAFERSAGLAAARGHAHIHAPPPDGVW